jgi:hypothetical protein
MKLDYLSSRCFLCGRKECAFNTESRICDCVRAQGFAENELACYVTFLPEPQSYSVSDLPSLWADEPADVFAIAADNLGAPPELISKQNKAVEKGSKVYPYVTDLLGTSHHLRCGNASVYRSASLEGLTGSDLVLVLDMGSYYWSGTLKDPRSWAIINTALACKTTEIAVWTAGNAGFSLAKLAHFVNRRLPAEQRLQVHTIVDTEVSPEIRAQLRLWQCEVLDIFRQDRPVLNPMEIRNLVAARIRRSRRSLSDSSYWHVTDGWDGVGLLMYRLIAAQVIRDLYAAFLHPEAEPLDIVLPVGTGDLLLGFYLGLRDCEQQGIVPRGACRLVGVLPAGDNILGNIRRRSIPSGTEGSAHSNGSNGAVPVMPKLKGLYTPLAPCLARIEKERAVSFIVVTEADQLRAGRQILSGGIDDGIVAEPSALATFGALPHLQNGFRHSEAENGRTYHCGRRLLMINSGLGIMGRPEETLLQRALGV